MASIVVEVEEVSELQVREYRMKAARRPIGLQRGWKEEISLLNMITSTYCMLSVNLNVWSLTTHTMAGCFSFMSMNDF